MTALTATAQAGSGTTPPRVLLQVTGAPTPPAAGYTGAFTASADGWTGAGTGVMALWNTGDTFLTLQSSLATGTVGNVITANRTVTGLTIGAVYKLRVTVTRSSTNAGNTRIRFGTATGAYVAVPTGTSTVLELTFTATATSHVISVDQQRAVTWDAERVYILAATVAPAGTWQGTTIRRTDINGTSVVVREDQGGMDTIAGGTMTLYDLEAGLTGPVGYAVTDGNGVITYAATSYAAGARVNLDPNPSAEVSSAGWSGSGTGTTLTQSAGGDVGNGRIRVVTGTGTSSGASELIAGIIPGVRYGTRVRAQANAVSDFRLTMQWLDAAQAVLSSPSRDFLGVASGVFVTAYHDFVAPAGAVYLRRYLQRVNSSTSGVVINLDAGLTRSLGAVEVFDPTEYFDGATPATDAYVYGWLGVPHLSPSMRVNRGDTAAGVWLTLPATATPSAGTVTTVPLELVLDYAEASESNGSLHKIIGRRDPIANPGPLSLRDGTLELYCRDYLTAKLLRDALSTGEVALVRQPTYLGLDVYFVTQRISIDPADDETVTARRRWVATIDYVEVVAT